MQPQVLEAVPFVGVTLTPFQERMAHDMDTQVVLRPLYIPDGDNNRRRRVSERLQAFTKTASASKAVPTSVKVRCASPALVLSRIRRRALPPAHCKQLPAPSSQTPTSIRRSRKESVGLVLNSYLVSKLIAPDKSLNAVTPADVAEGRLALTNGATHGTAQALRARG